MNADASATRRSSKWLLSPVYDYIFVCGGLVWLLFMAHFWGLGSGTTGSASLLLGLSTIGALVLAEGHTAASFVNALIGKKQVGQHPIVCGKWAVIVFSLMACIGAGWTAAALVLAKIYLLMVPHHFMAQAYGVAKLLCHKHEFKLTEHEDRGMRSVCQMTALLAFARQLGVETPESVFLDQVLPQWNFIPDSILDTLTVLLGVTLFYFLVLVMKRAVCTKSFMPGTSLLTLATGIAAFTMSQEATGIYWLYVSAFYHATQYFAVLLATMKRDVLLKFLGKTALLSAFLYMGVPKIVEQFGGTYAVAAVSLFAVINIYHITIDSVVWGSKKSAPPPSIDTKDAGSQLPQPVLSTASAA